ncbi:MAG: flagellar hook-basal body protein [Lachnospiraceae bacterium]|jgi:flagellar basal-body rod protein FlgG|nr:flagellar hook-basal body protein [Lachnospiraceae bacterium]
MYQSFYSAAVGASAYLSKLSVTSNNLANINNYGFKPKNVAFSDLINYNLNDSEDAVTELMAGDGMRVQRTYTNFGTSAATMTNQPLDFAILQDNAFFMVQDVGTEAISYTRSGRFHRGELDGKFYLMTDSNRMVLDRERKPIEVGQMADEESAGEDLAAIRQSIGLYTFSNPSRLANTGDNEFVPVDEGAEPILIENPQIASSALESSGTDMAEEMVKVIEAQRAFTYALKMVTTSDEIESTINSLRG